jgi:hypothetical protein
MAASISEMLELLEIRRTISFCWASRVDSCDVGMCGCGGNEVSIADASCDFATDEGRVSGSKSALRTRASFAESVGGSVDTAIARMLPVYSRS